MKKQYKIDKKIYNQDLVEKSIIDFSEVAKIEFIDYSLVIHWENEQETDNIFNEIMNYIIWIYNEQ